MLMRTLACDVQVCPKLAARQPPVWVGGIGRRLLNNRKRPNVGGQSPPNNALGHLKIAVSADALRIIDQLTPLMLHTLSLTKFPSPNSIMEDRTAGGGNDRKTQE